MYIAAFAQGPDALNAAINENKKISGEHNKPIFNRGELTFGTFLGLCTGYLVKKVGKIFAAFVGTGFVFLQVKIIYSDMFCTFIHLTIM